MSSVREDRGPRVEPEASAGAVPSQARRHFDELDSLRGLAALTVVVCHYFGTWLFTAPGETFDGSWHSCVAYSPLRCLWYGYPAVMLFFVISGFVLSLPYWEGRAGHFGPFLIRRFCRIYPPYLVAIAITVLVRPLVGGDPIPELYKELNRNWVAPVEWGPLMQHLGLIGASDHRYLPMAWTLAHEMRISIVFPLLMAVCLRLRTSVVIVGSMGLVLLSLLLETRAWPGWLVRLAPFQTLQYIPLFLFGALLARHRADLPRWSRALGRLGWAGVLLSAFLLCSYADQLPTRVAGLRLGLSLPVLSSDLGAVLFLVAALGSPVLSAGLRRPAPRFLGRISYSIYLFHYVLLLGLAHALRGLVPFWWILCGTTGLLLPVSAEAYRWVELPSIAVGRTLARAAERRIAGRPA